MKARRSKMVFSIYRKKIDDILLRGFKSKDIRNLLVGRGFLLSGRQCLVAINIPPKTTFPLFFFSFLSSFKIISIFLFLFSFHFPSLLLVYWHLLTSALLQSVLFCDFPKPKNHMAFHHSTLKHF